MWATSWLFALIPHRRDTTLPAHDTTRDSHDITPAAHLSRRYALPHDARQLARRSTRGLCPLQRSHRVCFALAFAPPAELLPSHGFCIRCRQCLQGILWLPLSVSRYSSTHVFVRAFVAASVGARGPLVWLLQALGVPHGASRGCLSVLLVVRVFASAPVGVRPRRWTSLGFAVVLARLSVGPCGCPRFSPRSFVGVCRCVWVSVGARRCMSLPCGLVGDPCEFVVCLFLVPSGSPWVSSWRRVGDQWVCRGVRVTFSL